jgi:hypothetical protein
VGNVHLFLLGTMPGVIIPRTILRLVPTFYSVHLFRWEHIYRDLISLKNNKNSQDSASPLSSMHHQTSWDLLQIIKIQLV